jgi:antirestriction protein ArdC
MSKVETRGSKREIKAQSSTNRETVSERVKEILSRVESMSNEEFLQTVRKLSSSKLHNYSMLNQFLLVLQGATQAASFNNWKKLGRSVKKGSKALVVLAPMKKTIWIDKENEETGEIERVKKSIILGFKDVNVFDISQTEGKEIEQGLTKSSNVEFEELKRVAEKLGFEVELKGDEIKTGGYIYGNQISLNSNLTQAENTATLLHELAHGVLKHTAERHELTKQQKEFEAETVTALLCADYGIERKSEIYLKSWQVTAELIEDIKQIESAYKTIKEAL